MATVINLMERQAKRRPATARAAVPEGGARIYLFTGVRYERYQADTQTRPAGSTQARKR